MAAGLWFSAKCQISDVAFSIPEARLVEGLELEIRVASADVPIQAPATLHFLPMGFIVLLGVASLANLVWLRFMDQIDIN